MRWGLHKCNALALEEKRQTKQSLECETSCTCLALPSDISRRCQSACQPLILNHSEVTKLVATERKASSGHSLNQSIVQQFTSEGNMRSLVRNASPNGLMAITMWRLVRHWSTK